MPSLVLQDKLNWLEEPLQALTNKAHSAQCESRKCMEKLNAFTADVSSCKSDGKNCLEKMASLASDVAPC